MRLVAAVATGAAVFLLVGLVSGNLPDLRRRRRRRSQVSPRQTWLLQAGLDLTPGQLAAGCGAVGVVVFVLVLGLTATPVVAVVPAVTAALAPRGWLARQRARRLRRLQEAWPDGIRDLLAGTSAGLSLHQALLAVADGGPPALRTAFARYPTLARILGVVPALEVIKEELADPTSDRVIEVLVLAHERGGHVLTDILRDLAQATTRDLRALEQITTDGLEQRINARAVFALPWLVLLLLTAQEGFFRDFYRSSGGVAVVAVGGVLSLAGLAVVSRLSRDPVETRVLGAAATPSPHAGEGRP